MSLASVSIATAQSLMNDTAGTIWNSTTLIPFLNVAYRELQTKLKKAGCPVQMADQVQNIASATTTMTITRVIEPITLWEKVQGDPDMNYVKMTEKNILTFRATTSTLKEWRWNGNLVEFVGATANNTVKSRAWVFNLDIASPSDNIPFVNAENYLGPKTASLANESIGETEQSQTYMMEADKSLDEIIISNRGVTVSPRP